MLSHFGEHMMFQSSEKYNYLYPFTNNFYSIKGNDLNGETSDSYQLYYIDMPFNFNYEKAMDVLSEAFRHPLYSPELIKNEI